jgi:hypothetical protein
MELGSHAHLIDGELVISAGIPSRRATGPCISGPADVALVVVHASVASASRPLGGRARPTCPARTYGPSRSIVLPRSTKPPSGDWAGADVAVDNLCARVAVACAFVRVLAVRPSAEKGGQGPSSMDT